MHDVVDSPATQAPEPPNPTESGRPRRRWTWRLGLVLVLVGAVILGSGLWQYVGTNIVAQREHRAQAEELRQDWSGPDATAGAGPRQGKPYALLRIPAFGVDYEVPIIEGVTDDTLARGVAHFPDTAGPGDVGNYALAAHRVTHGEPFRDLPGLAAGDRVIIETRDFVYTYALWTNGTSKRVYLDETDVLDPAPLDTDSLPGPNKKRVLTLLTCAELFHTDDRLIVYGHLVETQEKP